ncbi:hypothetical protein IE53DRAFT_60332 [Violaceomyces palustris]|uniref:Uncharacterized protein n=1 Tax=Violaceomyces palustris TaxID=1673888 RepID=A0ACD0NZN6_9BASI|nr:hypothetical protein IE53DRAFT_60332 [Violaceomyces palustris]
MLNQDERQITPTSPSPSPSPGPQAPSGTQQQALQAQVFGLSTAAKESAETSIDREEQLRQLLENRVRNVVDSLYQLAVCTADVQEGSEHLIRSKINESVQALAELDRMKGDTSSLVPGDVIDMLDAGRNLDNHTRNFINRLASENQYSYGQHIAMEVS